MSSVEQPGCESKRIQIYVTAKIPNLSVSEPVRCAQGFLLLWCFDALVAAIFAEKAGNTNIMRGKEKLK